MPKLLQINATANWGSTGKIAEQIGQRAMEHGWESYIAYGRKYNPSKSKLIKVGGKLNPYIHFVKQFIFDTEGLNSIHATKKLINRIKSINPDIIHLHNIHDHWLSYKILFEYLNTINTPVVWTFHDCWAFTGHCMHFIHSNCNKWKTMCSMCPQKGIFLDHSFRNYNLKSYLFTNNNLTIVPVSQWMAEFVKESFLRDKKIKVIQNGVDVKIFTPTDKKNNDKFTILAVSNVWNKSKGLYDIFKLRELLPTEYEIVVVGLSLKQIKDLPLGIKGIQRTQNIQELVNLYSMSNVFVNPTYADTFPTVNIEALACGIPVITYKTGGSPEAVDEKTGVVVEQGNVNALAEAIKQIKNTPFSSQDCRQRAEQFFNKNKCFDKYIELYNELINI